jgi:uncharacterized protein (TIGR02996 family)
VDRLLADVVARRDDDAPRLAYAAALLAEGDARGRLVEVQCELARLGRLDPRRRALEAEEAALLATHGAEWAAPVLAALGARAGRFVRGFVEHVVLDAASFLENGMGLVGSTVRSVRIVDGGERLDEILDSPFVGLLRGLDLAGCRLHNLAAERIADAAGLARLRVLELGGNDLDDRGVERLAGSRHLSLARLGLAGNVVTDEGVRAVGAGTACAGLRDLDLSRVPFGDGFGSVVRGAAVAALADLPLRRLVLRGNPVGEAGARALGAGFGELRELDLAGAALGPSAAWELAAAPSLAGLELLDLGGNSIGDAGARALASGPFLPRALSLIVRDCGLSEAAHEALAARFAEVVS